MLKRRIPAEMEFDRHAVMSALQAVISAQGIALNDGPQQFGLRGNVIFLDNAAAITPAQAQALKDAILPLLSSVQDIGA